jgi:Tol biopolymer transport system component/tetratricopeptide (TPR) repeat protein
MGYYKSLKKIIATVVIIVLIFQSNIFLHSQKKDEIKTQLGKSIKEYEDGLFDSSKKRLERTISIIKRKKLERKNILGQCYLLLGAIYEKKGETLLAEENYRRAKEQYGVEPTKKINLDDLPIYKRVVKGEIDIETQFQKAVAEYNNGQYDSSKNTLEQIIGIIKAEGLEVGKKDIFGKCYLLLGAIYEKEGNVRLAEENYRKAIEEYGIQSVEGVDLAILNIYKNMVIDTTKGQIPKEVKKEKKRKKKFPWLLVAVGAAVVTVVVILLLKKKKYTLNVTREQGVEGNPASGAYRYKKGKTVNYGYTLQSGYTDLVVTLDGREVASSGAIKIDSDHTLIATATQTYTLTVTKGEGVEGSPDSGTFTYITGETVDYSYTLRSGYGNLVVQFDGNDVSTSGTIEMNQDHTLTAIALNQYTSDKIVFSSSRSGNSDIWIMDEDGSNQLQLTFSTDIEFLPTFSPDGTKIAFINGSEKQLIVMNIDGTNQIPIYTSTAYQIAYPAWSPDGSKISFRQGPYNYYDMWVINSDGSNPQNITNDGMHNGRSSWSPDGSKIVHDKRSYAHYSYSVEIWITNSDGSNKKQLTSGGWCGYTCENASPDWSPDGTKVVYQSGEYGHNVGSNMYPHDIYIMNPDGKKRVRITTDPDWDKYPFWSPDGKKIAFYRGADIYVMKIDGTGETRLTYTGNNDLGDWVSFKH